MQIFRFAGPRENLVHDDAIYYYAMHEKGRPVLDAEFYFSQELRGFAAYGCSCGEQGITLRLPRE